MNPSGWFGVPWGLLALASLPAVVFLHLYRHRHDELPVSTLFLWTDDETEARAGRVRHPLRRTPSFWLELLAALLASLLVAEFDPWQGGEALHLVAVLDDSASMQAGEGAGDSPRRRAAQLVEAALEDHGRDTRVTLVASGPRPRLLCGPGALPAEARSALASWRPSAPAHDLTAALALGRELAGDGALWLLTDRRPEGTVLDAATRVDALGTPRGNLALLAPERSALPDGERHRVRCEVASFADGPREARLVVSAAGRELARRDVDLAPGGRVHLDLEVPADAPPLDLVLSDDALALDNHVRLHPPPRRTLNVGWALDEGLPALLGLTRLVEVLPDVRWAAEGAHLVLAHAPAPPPAWSLVLPPDGDAAEAYIGPFLVDRRHPLLEGVTLDGVLWSRALPAPPPGQPLVAAGDRPLLTAVSGDAAAVAQTTFHLDLAASRSTLHRSPDWPILLANLVELRRAALHGPRATNLAAGERFRASTETPVDWTLSGPDGERRFEDTAVLILDDLPPAPDWRLLRDGAAPIDFAVNLVDPAESDLRGAESVRAGLDDLVASAGSLHHAGSVTSTLLLVLLACAVAADWWWIGRGPRP